MDVLSLRKRYFEKVLCDSFSH